MERRKHSRGGGSRAGKTKKELFAEAARKQARAERARKTAKLCRVPVCVEGVCGGVSIDTLRWL